jgi:multisubunit Na+/H+ antiporter MnhF subunit
VCFAYLYALLIVVASFLAVWLRIVRPPEAA